jgi:hypothetical protein
VAELLTETSVKEEGRRRPKRSYPWRSSAPLVDAGLAALRHHAVDLPLLASSADAPPPCGSGELQGRPEDGYHATTGNLRVRSRRGHWTGLSRSLRRGAEGADDVRLPSLSRRPAGTRSLGSGADLARRFANTGEGLIPICVPLRGTCPCAQEGKAMRSARPCPALRRAARLCGAQTTRPSSIRWTATSDYLCGERGCVRRSREGTKTRGSLLSPSMSEQSVASPAGGGKTSGRDLDAGLWRMHRVGMSRPPDGR